MISVLAGHRGIQLPLVEGGGVASVPCGVLELRLVKLKGLQSEDLLGHSDPYVKIRVRTELRQPNQSFVRNLLGPCSRGRQHQCLTAG
jgi:Ca2+-dependent lipid-binding protein